MHYTAMNNYVEKLLVMSQVEYHSIYGYVNSEVYS